MKRFCYKCGALEAETGPLVQGLCQRCFSENQLMQAPSEIDVVVCKKCGAYKVGNQWRTGTSGDLDAAVRETVLDAVRIIRHTESDKSLLRPVMAEGVRVEVMPSIKKNMVNIITTGKVHPLQAQPKTEEVALKLNMKYSTCEVCSLKSAKHHDAILQLRDAPSREFLFKAQRAIEKLAARESKQEPKDFIADIKEQHGGLDFYVSSVNLAKKMAAFLKYKFGASIIESAKLIGQTKDGRMKYRVSILARLEK